MVSEKGIFGTIFILFYFFYVLYIYLLFVEIKLARKMYSKSFLLTDMNYLLKYFKFECIKINPLHKSWILGKTEIRNVPTLNYESDIKKY